MKSDFLALILLGVGGSSYARGPDKEECVERVGRTLVADWSSMFDVAGKPAKVGVYDVTGEDGLYWDARGVWAKRRNPEPDKLIDPLEIREVTLPANRRR